MIAGEDFGDDNMTKNPEYRVALEELDRKVDELYEREQPACPTFMQRAGAYIARNLRSRIVQCGGAALLAFGAGVYFHKEARDSYEKVVSIVRAKTTERLTKSITVDQAADRIAQELKDNPRAALEYQDAIARTFSALPEQARYQLLLDGVRKIDGSKLSDTQLRELRDAAVQSKVIERIITLPPANKQGYRQKGE